MADEALPDVEVQRGIQQQGMAGHFLLIHKNFMVELVN